MSDQKEFLIRERILNGCEFSCQDSDRYGQVAIQLQNEGHLFECLQHGTGKWMAAGSMAFDCDGPYRIVNPNEKELPPPPSTFSLDSATATPPKQKTLGEILYDAFEDQSNGCDEWSRTSEKFKKEYEDAADAVREAVESQQPLCQKSLWIDQRDEWASKFQSAIALVEKEQKRSEDYAKQRDAYIKLYDEVAQRRNELEQEISVLKNDSVATAERCSRRIDERDWRTLTSAVGVEESVSFERLIEFICKTRDQLPVGMEHCKIIFKECEKGHGELTAANWVQHSCLHCENAKLKEQSETKSNLIDEMRAEISSAYQVLGADGELDIPTEKRRPLDSLISEALSQQENEIAELRGSFSSLKHSPNNEIVQLVRQGFMTCTSHHPNFGRHAVQVVFNDLSMAQRLYEMLLGVTAEPNQSTSENAEELNKKRQGGLNQSSPVTTKPTQRDSLYVLIVRDEGGENFSVCSFMQPTVTHSQMSAVVNILSEQLADGIGNLSEFQTKKESLQ